MAQAEIVGRTPATPIPGYQKWVNETLRLHGGLRTVLAGVTYVLRHDLRNLRSVDLCVGQLLKGGVLKPDFRDAMAELKTVPPHDRDLAERIRHALAAGIHVVGFRKDPRHVAQGRRGGRRRAVKLRAQTNTAEDAVRSRATRLLSRYPDLRDNLRQLARKTRDDFKANDPAYEMMFSDDDERALNRIYKHIRALFSTRRTRTLKKARRG
jgi:hypothetical protein